MNMKCICNSFLFRCYSVLCLNFSVKLLTIAAIYYFNRSEYPMNTSPMNPDTPSKYLMNTSPMKAAAPPNAAPTAVHSFTITTT